MSRLCSYKRNGVRIAVVGLHFGKVIIKEILEGKAAGLFELAAVCDIVKEKADILAARLGVKAYYDLDSLLEDETIRAIALFTGPVGRASLIRKIMRSGRDIITTKPFELEPDEAMSVLGEARRLGRTVHMNSPSPVLSEELKQVKEWEQEYNLGQPVGCRCDTWVNYNEKPDGTWYDDAEKCPAAPIFRIGIYLINDLVRLMGRADKVQVMTSRIQTGRPTPDNAQLGILFKNGAITNIYASFCVKDSQRFKNSMVINYQNGTIYKNIEPGIPKGEKISYMTLVLPENTNNERIIKKEIHSSSGTYQWANFFKSVNGEKLDNEVEPWEIVEGIKIVKAMAKAEKFEYAKV